MSGSINERDALQNKPQEETIEEAARSNEAAEKKGERRDKEVKWSVAEAKGVVKRGHDSWTKAMRIVGTSQSGDRDGEGKASTRVYIFGKRMPE